MNVDASIAPDDRRPLIEGIAREGALEGRTYPDIERECQELALTFPAMLSRLEVSAIVRATYALHCGTLASHRAADAALAAPASPLPAQATPTSTLATRRMSEIAPSDVQWLSKGRLQRGALNLMAGPPHQGKTYAALDLLAHMSRGHAWPPGSAKETEGPLNALLIAGEDDPSSILRPRLDALGADLDRIVLLESIRLEGTTPRAPSLQLDLSLIGDWMHENEGGLLIVDPLFGALHGGERFDPHKYADMMRELGKIARWASETGVCLLAIVHLTKSRTDRLLSSLQGSAALSAVPRCVLMVEQETDDDGQPADGRLMRSEKHSASAKPATRRFYLRPHAEGNGAPPSLEWDPHDVDAASDQDAFHPERDVSVQEKGSRSLQCADWLCEVLTETPIKVTELRLLAGKKGWSEDILRRASEHALLRERSIVVKKTRDASTGHAMWLWSIVR